MTSANLTDQQLALLMNVAGKSTCNTGSRDQTLGQILESFDSSGSSREMKAIYELVSSDPDLSSLTFKRDTAFSKGKESHQAYLFEDSSGNPVVVFEGTQGLDDAIDDAKILAWESSAQREALEYIEREVRAEYGSRDITVTGHSLGGNLAEYVAIKSSHVSRCVAFNALGFSDSFMVENAGLIRANWDKIIGYNQAGDAVVSRLGNRIGFEIRTGGTLNDASLSGPLFYHLMPGFFLYWEDEFGNLHVNTSVAWPPRTATSGYNLKASMPSTNATRDFSDEKLEYFRDIIRKVNAESPLDIVNWDVWHYLEFCRGKLRPENYQNNIGRYYYKIFDLSNVSAAKIESIFTKARQRDAAYAAVIGSIADSIDDPESAMRGFLA